MNHCDAEISDLVVVLKGDYAERQDEAEKMLRDAGMQIRSSDQDNGVVEGSIETRHLHELKKLPCVEYVRSVFTYVADYPAGDPRDQDKDCAKTTDDGFWSEI
ncbi:MAG: hypothetical protein IT447_13215 [Phycisphaerales bacterium]|jgi:hypothetical protein|nr:hypothetical protein [Phycisphaerales bacterium]